MEQIRWGIIGCGSVTEVKSGPAFQKAEGSSLVAVMCREGKKAEDWARRHTVAKWYDDAQELIDDPEVDAVYIATPPAFHRQYVLQAAAKHKIVYCEKPLGISWAQSKEMVDYCTSHSVPFFSAYYRRALGKYQQIKKLLDEGSLGRVRGVHLTMLQTIKKEDIQDGGSWRVHPEISGGGRFHDVGSHALDLIDYFLGPVVAARGEGLNQSKSYPASDVVHGYFRTETGVAGTGLWCFNTFKDEDTTTLYLEKGSISYSVLDLSQPITVTTEAGNSFIEVENPPLHVEQPLIQSIVDHLLGKGTCESTGESAMRTDWVLEQLGGEPR